ncbi:hypothetical protein HLA87_02480 [Mycoplasma miroungigenitalium]|uniref:Uncharacterized protein n=1 Tax=Mycoplasma miroungigenitalium TaxID=754515 RepID=A0A6M4JG27_9MOLU|nr:hypothetical protein [Mycoplasma miroungigenitalium]QJR43641.1 hypothetical protein HLA87_02480 [Mycoplasma miroungigenitalium]
MPENKNNDSWFESLAQYLVATPTERPYVFSPKNTNPKYQGVIPEFDYKIAPQEIKTSDWTCKDIDIVVAFLTAFPTEASERNTNQLLQALTLKKIIKKLYNQNRITYFYEFEYKSKVYSFIVVISNIWDKPTTQIFFKDKNTNKKLPHIFKVDQLRSGYIFGICEIDNILHVIKFNDFTNETNGDKVEVSQIFKSTFPEDSKITTFKMVTFSESFNNDNYVDVMLQTPDNKFWYGQINTDITNTKNTWLHYSPVYIGIQGEKFDENTNLRVCDLNSMTISTMLRKENDTNAFYGNVVLGINSGSEIYGYPTKVDSNYVTTEKSGNFKELFEPFHAENFTYNDLLFNSNNRKNNVEFTMNIGSVSAQIHKGSLSWGDGVNDIVMQYAHELASHPDTKEKQKAVAKSKMEDHWGEQLREFPTRPFHYRVLNWEPRHTDNFELPEWFLRLALQDPKKVNFKVTSEIENQNTILICLYLADKKFKEYRYSTPYFERQDSDLIEIEDFYFDCNFVVNLDARVRNTVSQKNRLFKLTFTKFDNSPNGLIFGIDRGIQDIGKSTAGVILSDTEIAVPVLTLDNKWKVYSFFNDSKFDESGAFNDKPPRLLGTLPTLPSTSTPHAYSVIETKNSHPYLFIIHEAGIHAFNGLYEGVNSPYNLNITQSIDLDNLMIFREQCLVKFLVNSGKVKKFLNLKYDQKPFNLSNVPFLYKTLGINNLSDNLNICILQDADLNFCVPIKDVTINDTTLTLSAIIKNTTLNTGLSKKHAKKFQWLDSVGNVAFEFTDSLSAKTRNDNYQVNSHIPFGYQYSDKHLENHDTAKLLTHMWKNSSVAKDFLHSHMRFKYTDGTHVEVIVQELGINRLSVKNNRAVLNFKLGLKKEVGKVKKFYDFEIGNAETNNFKPLGEFETFIVDENTDGVAKVGTYEYEFLSFGK